jgi:uncharacterized membrane protein
VAKRYAEQQIVIAGAPQLCFEALIEYETFPQWQRAVSSVEVLTRDRDGRGEHVAFEVDAKVRRISYELRYSYEPPHRISWDYVDGDVKDIAGEYILEDRGDGTTLATYSVGLDPGLWVPGPLFRVLNEQVMRASVQDLKRRVEGG